MYLISDLVVLKKECNLRRFVMELSLGLVLFVNGGEIVGDNGVMFCI